jgi:hypothetical protein
VRFFFFSCRILYVHPHSSAGQRYIQSSHHFHAIFLCLLLNFFFFFNLFQGRAREEYPGVSGLLRPPRLRLFVVQLITKAKKRTASVGGGSGSSGLASLSCWTTFNCPSPSLHFCSSSLGRPTRPSRQCRCWKSFTNCL